MEKKAVENDKKKKMKSKKYQHGRQNGKSKIYYQINNYKGITKQKNYVLVNVTTKMIKSFDEDTRHSITKDSSFFEIMQVTVKTTKAKIKIDGKEENSSITSVSTRVQSKTKSFIRNSTNDINTTAHHETAIRGGIRCKEIPCYMSYLTCK